MPNVGVKDLKNQAFEILRRVREEQAEYIVTYHGRQVRVQGRLSAHEVDSRVVVDAAEPVQSRDRITHRHPR